MKRKSLFAVLIIMLLITFLSCNNSPSEPQATIRKIIITGGYSLSEIPTEVKDGTVITFPNTKINNHDYTLTISNKTYSAGDEYTVKSDVIINVLLNHIFTPWENNGTSTHVRHCTIGGCNEVNTRLHNFIDGECTVCGYKSILFTISDTLLSDTKTTMSNIASNGVVPSDYLVTAGKIESKVSSIKLGEKTYQEDDTIKVGDLDSIKVFTIENGELKIAAPILWFSMLDYENLIIESETFILPRIDDTQLSIDKDKIKWSEESLNEAEVLYEGSIINTLFKDENYNKHLTLSFKDTDDTKFIYRIMNINSDGSYQTSYVKESGDIDIYPFGKSEKPVSPDDLKTVINISSYSENGYGQTLLVFQNGAKEIRVNPTNIENGETVKINKDSGVLYSVVTNFMSGYSTSEEYEGDSFKSNATVTNNLDWSESRSLSRATSAINISKPTQNEKGVITWNGMYVYHGDNPEQRDMKDIIDIDNDYIISGRDYDNGLLYLIDQEATEDDLKMVNEILNVLYYSGDESLMPNDYLDNEQALLKTKPNEKYLFTMKDDNKEKHKLFTIAIYDFKDEGMLGYFSSALYNTSSSRNGYAAFYMNLSSIRRDYEKSGAKVAAESFLKTFAHEYTHYLQVDRKYNDAYTQTVDLAHFLEEGLADYISLKQNGLFDQKDGAYKEEHVYIQNMFSSSDSYHPRSKEENVANYGVGCMFWSYIEEKYADYGGMEVIVNLMRQDTDTLEAVERELKKPFNEVYEDFMLEVIAEALGTNEINGIKREMKFPELYDVKKIFNEATQIEEDSSYTIDVTKSEMDVELGPMSFSIVRYEKIPTKLTFTSDSAEAKCYLVYTE